jgi:hypothetical protein
LGGEGYYFFIESEAPTVLASKSAVVEILTGLTPINESSGLYLNLFLCT